MTCPAASPPPPGYRLWNPSLDGTAPAAAVAVARALAYSSAPYGTSQTVCVAGQPLLVRVDPHTASTDVAGNPIAGCFHGATVYRPTGALACASAATRSSWSTGETALAVAAVLGAALGATLFARRRGWL